MTDAQKLVAKFRQLVAPGSTTDVSKWAHQTGLGLTALGDSTIGRSERDGRPVAIWVFRCADGSRFAYNKGVVTDVWAMPAK